MNELEELFEGLADLYVAEERVHWHKEEEKRIWLDPGHTPTERERASTQLRLARELLAYALKSPPPPEQAPIE